MTKFLKKVQHHALAASVFTLLAIPPGGEPVGGGIFSGCGGGDGGDAGVEVPPDPPEPTKKRPKPEPSREEVSAAEAETRRLSPMR